MNYISIFGLFVIFSNANSIPENCREQVNRGHSKCAKPQKSIQYHYDNSLEMCLPFLYEGCGGNRNRFEDDDQCIVRCRPADKGICGGNSKPTGSCSSRNKTCAKGSRCIIMAFGIGMCYEWIRENHPKCSEPGFSVVTEPAWYGQREVLGKSCAHRFCPIGSKCIDGRWLAYCCQPIKNS
ncbi:unnamed protein product [Caenorhabditis angaria]|uniref:BPTI/Kunitz inhibitor domain-containing protein n=1 Tax=Caenorhabditis angaria TaxID=860376 RepID=A0A9P1IVP4_9PELO|nr:unnamed protein product [Caenorhabditis angaria]